MSNTDKLREIAEPILADLFEAGMDAQEVGMPSFDMLKTSGYIDRKLSDLTALISEGYVEKAKYDEAVRQRDELKQKLSEIFAICEDGQELNMSNYNHDDVSALNQTFVEIYIAVEAAIKNTEG